MGVDVWAMDFLFRLRNRGVKFGRTLSLGRAGIYLPEAFKPMAQQIVESYDPGTPLEKALGSPIAWAEPFFTYLGSTSVQSLDASNYEGALYVWDLNRPIPSSLRGQFDTTYDGGTLEHVFNFPIAIQNVKDLLKIGGTAIMVTPANNWLGHGLYQFSPELLYQCFSPECGFEVEVMEFVEVDGYPSPRNADNPIALGQRIEIHRTKMPTYLLVGARKTAESRPVEFMQSDYVDLWKK